MSWKDLYELAPQLTASEVRFERAKRAIGLFLGPICFVVFLLSPPWEHVTPTGMRTLAVFSLAIVWWITEAIPIPATSLLMLPLLVICGILPMEKAFSYWAHWANLFLVGAFIIGHAMHLHGLTRRFSLTLVASRLVGGSPWRLLVLYLIADVLLSGVLSNTVTSVLFLSMGLGLLQALKIPAGSSYGMAMFLGIAWATNIGGVLTPGGTPTNLIAIGLAEPVYRIGYAQWILGNLPFTVLQMVAMFFVLRLFLKKEDARYELPQESIREELRRMGPLSRGEIYAAVTMVVALVLWVSPDVSTLLLGKAHPVSAWLNARLNWAVVGLAVASSLFLMPLDWKTRRFAMTWDEAVGSIEWGTIILVAGALAIGEVVGTPEIGLGGFFSNAISSVAGPETSSYLFLLITITVATLLTNVTTNVGVISFMGPIAMAVAPGLGLNPVALTATVSISSCIAYALPMANPPCAIVFASGYVRILPMFIRGMLLSLIGIILLSVVGYGFLAWMFTVPGAG